MNTMRLMKLYPDYISFDRRQAELVVKDDRRQGKKERRKGNRAILSTKLREELSVFKVLAGHLFSNQH